MTDVALKEYLEAQITALRRETVQQREADWRALDLARENLALRLEGMNEFRAQIIREREDYVRIDTFRWVIGALLALSPILAVILARTWH
jgi:hypothetical protein